MRKLLLSLMLLAASLHAAAYDFTVDGIYYNILDSETCEVTYETSSYNSYWGTVNIPSQVTSIAERTSIYREGRRPQREVPLLTLATHIMTQRAASIEAAHCVHARRFVPPSKTPPSWWRIVTMRS
ncbi:MAG: hypothetical protein HUK03_09420 [Bacteroidaceae bacterium]|nr:hypothetical protein [Bacteroidaceae bacterium]